MIAALQPVSGPGVLKSAPPSRRVLENTSENKARRAYQNVLKAARLDFPRVVQVRCYRTNQNDWDAHNLIYGQFFFEPFPARTTLIGCLEDLVKCEVDCVAYAGSETREFYVN